MSSNTWNSKILIAITTIMTLAAQRILRSRRKKMKHPRAPRRIGGAIQLRPEMYNRYTQLHDLVWDEVIERLYKSNIRNFTIHFHKETNTLFSHFEWIGNVDCNDEEEVERRLKADMDAIAMDPATKEWWSYCEPCQRPFSQWPVELPPPSKQQGVIPKGDWWSPLVCLCHCGYWPVEYTNVSRDPDFKPRNLYGHISTREKPPSPLV